VIAQIYGITTVDDARMVAALGADHVGVVPETTPDNWDGVDVDTAHAILRCLPASVAGVVLSLATDVDAVLGTARAVPGDVVHVVRTDVLGAADLAAIRREAARPLMATVGVDGPEAVARARTVASVADYLLLDSRHPTTGVVGASGHTHDWAVSATIVREVARPVILAGGLGPGNVEAAIRRVRPWGVDSETRTSRDDDRRRKDPDRVREFVERAHARP
jgi:phosphoribosylanthranilate isomerase